MDLKELQRQMSQIAIAAMKTAPTEAVEETMNVVTEMYNACMVELVARRAIDVRFRR